MLLKYFAKMQVFQCCAILLVTIQFCKGIEVKELTMDDMKQILIKVPEDGKF